MPEAPGSVGDSREPGREKCIKMGPPDCPTAGVSSCPVEGEGPRAMLPACMGQLGRGGVGTRHCKEEPVCCHYCPLLSLAPCTATAHC